MSTQDRNLFSGSLAATQHTACFPRVSSLSLFLSLSHTHTHTYILTGVTEGESLAREFGCRFLETSAKRGVNVEQAFYDLVREIRQYNIDMSSSGHGDPALSPRTPTGKLGIEDDREPRGCCGKCSVM